MSLANQNFRVGAAAAAAGVMRALELLLISP
jgi:hypothetical protein